MLYRNCNTYARSWILCFAKQKWEHCACLGENLQLTFEAVCQVSGKASEGLWGLACKHIKTVERSAW